MDSLFEIQRIKLEQFDPESIYHRSCYNTITLDNYGTGITGQRGIGKTTWLLFEAVKLGARNRKAL